jgi:hypothetical protein
VQQGDRERAQRPIHAAPPRSLPGTLKEDLIRNLYVIEKRSPNGLLLFSDPQPESVFGLRAITGITEDLMARVIFARLPEAVLDGRFVSRWPALIDSNFVARRKTWTVDMSIWTVYHSRQEVRSMANKHYDRGGAYAQDGTFLGTTGPRCEDAPCCGCCS